MAATDYAATPTIYDPTLAVTRPADGDTVSKDNLYLEAAPGAKPKLTLALVYDHIAALAMPPTSLRGALGANETLTPGHAVYLYDAPTGANRVVFLPSEGDFDGQTILVRGTMKNPTYSLEFQHTQSSTVPITFSSTSTTKRPWAYLSWSTISEEWEVGPYGGGATLP